MQQCGRTQRRVASEGLLPSATDICSSKHDPVAGGLTFTDSERAFVGSDSELTLALSLWQPVCPPPRDAKACQREAQANLVCAIP